MAIVPMQKVAVVAHKKHESDLIGFLHREGVMEITELPDAAAINTAELPFHAAELDHVIALLEQVADKDQLAALKSPAATDDVLAAGKNPAIRGIIDHVHALEQQLSELKQQQSDLDHGRLPDGQEKGSATPEEGTYFSSPGMQSDLSGFGGAAGAASTEAVAARSEQVKAAITAVHVSLGAIAAELPLLARARICVRWMNEMEAARRTMQTTQSTVTLFGWIAKHLFDPLERKLERLSPATALLRMEPAAGEQAPVLIKNPAWLKPFESVTLLYGLPQNGELDPTPLLAPFFILFFALCLTDAGYGLVLAAAMAIYIRTKKLKLEDAPLWWLLMIGGLMTFVVSIPFGGWFGMTPEQAPAFLTERRADGALWFKGQIWNLGATPGITFFQNLSIILGLIHLVFGMVLGGISKGLRGSWAEGFWMDWTQILLVGSVIAYFLVPETQQSFALWGMIASLVLVIWGKGYGSVWYLRPLNGFLGLLNLAMGMMSNTLSYLRLLALGLVTGALALAVNLVAKQIGGFLPPALGVPVSIVIYIAGHTVNIALNVLGAFIHSGRLQFVEFFSQFFEGGGRQFNPFRRSSAH
jgi:vacuolar-type H+-ATPase subunit I/STV1